MYGDDVYGVKRSVLRLLDALDHGQRLKELETKSPATKRRYGAYFVIDVNKARKAMGFRQTGVVDQLFWAALAKGGWPDARAIDLMNNYIDSHPQSTIVFPIPMGEAASICQGLHETGGLAGNWAIDICCVPRTTVVAVEAGAVYKLSGRPPTQDTWDTQGVFGWTVYFRTDAGYEYFVTHMGVRSVVLNDRLQIGDTIGSVGDQAFRPDHVHYGVTSPLGSADAKKRITAVSKAPRIL